MALTDNLISVWHMNNDWQDSWGTNHGTAYGATFSTSAKLGSHAGIFDEVDDKIIIANETAFDFDWNSPFTVAAWVKFTSSASIYVASKQMSAANNYKGWGCTLLAGKPSIEIISTISPAKYIDKRGTTAYNDNAYHRAVWTYSGSGLASGVKIYVDNVLQTMTTVNDTLSSLTILNDEPLQLGAYQSSSYYGGLGDEILVASREWTAADVTEDWNNGAGVEIGAATGGSFPFASRITQADRTQKAVQSESKSKAIQATNPFKVVK